MKKNGYFVKKVFLGFLFLNILSRFGYFINTMIDAFSGGNIIGEEALAVVSLISPLFYFISFFASLIGPGCAIIFAISVGKFEKEKADRYAGFSLLASILIGIFCSLFLLIIKEPFLKFYNLNNESYESASVYYNWYIALALLIPVYFSIYYLTLADGDAFYTMFGTVGEIVVNTILSIVLCKKLGIAGLGLSTFISYAAAMLLNCLHFLSKKNSIKFILCLKFDIFKQAVVFSINSALNNIFIVIVHLITNKIIIRACGSYYFPIYAIINFAISVFGIISAVGDSAKSICSTYYGEENYQGVKNTIRLSYKTILIMGSIITAILFVCSPFISKLFGITSNDLIDLSTRTTIIVAASTIPYGIAYFCYQIYSTINRPLLSLFSTFLFNFICPLVFSIPLAFMLGFDGVSIGICIGNFAAVVLFYLYLILRYKKQGFPLYLKETNERSYELDFVLSNESIVLVRNKITEIFNNELYETKKIDLLFEELLIRIFEKNNYKKISCECSIFVGSDYIRVIMRDNGIIFNSVDQDTSSDSINTILLNNLLTTVNEKGYLITSSVNRNSFIFRKKIS